MIIEPFKKYVVTCKDSGGTLYRWHLEVVPGNNAWKVVYENIVVGGNFQGYWIKEVTLEESLTPIAVGRHSVFSKENDLSADFVDDDDDQDFWNECPQCGEYIGIDGQCHSCGFDWDSCYGD